MAIDPSDHSPPAGLWERLKQRPDRAPELIALEASERLAPSAARWAASEAGRMPPHELAQLAVKRHVSLARREGAAAGLAGAWGIVPDLVAVIWIESRMVLHVAAAHGFDPAHPMRPAELLALQGLYETAAEARDALDGVGPSLAIQYAVTRTRSDEQITSRLAKLAGRHAAKRVAAKAIPGIASPIMAVQNGSAVAELGQRALRFYGG